MDCDRFQRMLADYIAGELSSADRAEAQAHVAKVLPLAELSGLQCAAAVLDSGRITAADAGRRAAVLPAPNRTVPASAPAPRRSIVPVMLRYAAVIALSFATGYALRGGGSSAAPAGPRIAAAPAPPAVIERYNAVTRERPEASTFSRSLLAVAAPTSGKP